MKGLYIMKNLWITFITFCMLILILCGCSADLSLNKNNISDDTDDDLTPCLEVYINDWSGWEGGSSSESTEEYTDLKKGDEIYSGYGSTIKVKSIDQDKIVLVIEDSCFVKSNGDGTISLRADPIVKLTIKKGETKAIDSATMDAGVSLKFTYK